MAPRCSSTILWQIVRPRPVPSPTGFVVKKGSKILPIRSAGIPVPRVLDGQPDPVRASGKSRSLQRVVLVGLDEDAPSLGREVDGVQEEVHQKLPEAPRVGIDLGDLPVQVQREGVLEPRGPVLKQEEHFLDELVDIDFAERACRGPGELEQAFQDPLAPEDLAVDRLQDIPGNPRTH